VHHLVAADWFDTVNPDSRLLFCRFTQLGLLRLLTAEAVMSEEVMNQTQAWRVYDQWLRDPRVDLMDEPPGLEARFRMMTRSRYPAPKDWADSYLAAFATAAQLTLVTFDRALKTKARPSLLLSG
jgi:toxin-antitoxin system PIN domain toxin